MKRPEFQHIGSMRKLFLSKRFLFSFLFLSTIPAYAQATVAPEVINGIEDTVQQIENESQAAAVASNDKPKLSKKDHAARSQKIKARQEKRQARREDRQARRQDRKPAAARKEARQNRRAEKRADKQELKKKRKEKVRARVKKAPEKIPEPEAPVMENPPTEAQASDSIAPNPIDSPSPEIDPAGDASSL
jgi:hypothetical protein